ncbi:MULTISPECIES: hypothetical protein [unclassified Legionella]|uniref:hypothetical protein n=1 Tax=unclassified Legionella TaxID=2622702 RepID=UPI0010544E19|nr:MULTISPECIES: hypothetical protein [unclassified Legionella]MDI9818371.1 hypothetical protein [Legionella sp. PL877]
MVSEKKFAQIRQQTQLRQFKLGNSRSLQVASISPLPGILYSPKMINYRKEEFPLSQAGALHFIKEDEQTENFVWHTTAAALQQALRYGLLEVESPTARAIAALGLYRRQILSRAHEKGIISHKFEQKEALVNIAQDNLASLQELELLANTFNANANLDLEKKRVQMVLDKVLKELRRQSNEADNTLESLKKFDKKAVEKMKAFYAHQIQLLENLAERVSRADANTVQSILKATGSDSIMTIAKTMSMATLIKIQELNQNITYSRDAKSLMRGDLNSSCEDALKALRDYEADPHNPILAAHQGRFYLEDNQKVAVDFSHLGHDEKKIKSTLEAIAAIDGHGIIKTDKGYTLDGHHLLTTRFTKWQVNAAPGYTFKRLSAGTVNVVIGVVVGLAIDLPLGFFTSFFSFGHYKMPSLASKLMITVRTNSPKNALAEHLYNKFVFKHYSAGTLLGQKLGSFISNTILDMANGIRASFQNLKFKGFDELRADFKTGAWGNDYASLTKQEQILHRLRSILDVKINDRKNLENQIRNKEKVILNLGSESDSRSLSASSSCFTGMPYHLNAGEWDDIGNAVFSGIEAVNDTFVHNIHAKHPFTGLIFSTSYAAGGLAIFTPGLFAFLPKSYLAFSHMVGDLMAHGTSSAAIASGFTQAKVFAALFEAAIHGGDSWIAIGTKQFERNPANTIVYGALAVGLGYTLANYLDIPWLSEHIREDVGSVAPVGWAFAGAKLGLLLIDLLEPNHGKPVEETMSSLEKELKNFCPEASEQQITSWRDSLVTDEQLRQRLQEQIENSKRILDEKKVNPEIEAKRLRFIHMLKEHQDLLPELDNTFKRELLMTARHLFQGIDNQNVMLRGLKLAFYPKPERSIFTRTITLITDYIPLLIRCLLSPVTASLQPWRDLRDKTIKDITRIPHGLSKLTTMFTRTFARVGFRGPADVFANEVAARMEGFIRNDSHSISGQTYKITNCYEKNSELLRQTVSAGTDAMRSAAAAPEAEVVFNKTRNQAFTRLSTAGFFNPEKMNSDQSQAGCNPFPG